MTTVIVNTRVESAELVIAPTGNGSSVAKNAVRAFVNMERINIAVKIVEPVDANTTRIDITAPNVELADVNTVVRNINVRIVALEFANTAD